jgi:arylsulfatase A-like enzyme
MWYCPGANHAPHHAPQEYIDKYKGQFDDGYGAYREWVLARMIEKGVLPPNTELTELNPMTPGTFVEGDSVRPWGSLSEMRKRCSAGWRRCTPRFRSTPTSRSGG